MRSFFSYIVSFSITHLFFAIFLFFGLGIFTEITEEQSSFIYPYVLYLCIIATLVQSLFFTLLSRFTDIAGVSFFISALVVELIVSNGLFFYYVSNKGYELKDSILMNGCLVAGLTITMLIKEYNAEESLV